MKDLYLSKDRRHSNRNKRHLLFLSYIVTDACNAACPHCTESPSAHPDPHELTTTEWNRISDEAKRMGVLSVSFAGGEPLLRPDLGDMIEYSSDLGLGVQLLSNGFGLTEELIDSLIDKGAKRFILSLDGADATTHDAFRGRKGLFDQVIQAIKILLTKDAKMSVNTVITTVNMDQIVDIMDMLEKMGVQHFTLLTLQKVRDAVKHPYLFPKDGDYIRILPKIYEKSNKLQTMKTTFPHLKKELYTRSLGEDAYCDIHQKVKIGLLVAGVFSLQIGPFGNVKSLFSEDNTCLGNVREQSLEDIWNSEKAIKMGELHKFQLKEGYE